jgi:YfiH family protein
MRAWLESEEAIGAVDAVLAGVGMRHGGRKTRGGTWKNGERVKAAKASAPVQTGPRKQAGIQPSALLSQLPWLVSGFSTRAGGTSVAYGDGELNLGWTREDDPRLVAANRGRFVQAVSGKSRVELVTLRQSHTGLVHVIEREHGPLVTEDGKAVLRGDGVITDVPGLLLGVQTADCVPVLLVDPKKKVVAAFHAGWRGTLKRIVERGVGTMQLRYGSRPEEIVAAIGPAIGACCFAVGEDVKFDFESQFAYAPELFSEVYDSDPVRDKYPLLFMTARAPGHSNIGPQIHLDLAEANRRQLLDAGLKAANIDVIGECTACTRLKASRTEAGARKYFSHRAESGYTGRMLSVIGKVDHG